MCFRKILINAGGVDGAIHKAAGPALRERCLEVTPTSAGVRCPTGEARVTNACELPCKRVIHTVGPVYSSRGESEPVLKQSVESSLSKAEEEELSTVCLPAISTGVYGYPHSEAAEATLDVARNRPEHSSLTQIHFAIMGEQDLKQWLSACHALLQQCSTENEATEKHGSSDGGGNSQSAHGMSRSSEDERNAKAPRSSEENPNAGEEQ